MRHETFGDRLRDNGGIHRTGADRELGTVPLIDLDQEVQALLQFRLQFPPGRDSLGCLRLVKRVPTGFMGSVPVKRRGQQMRRGAHAGPGLGEG